MERSPSDVASPTGKPAAPRIISHPIAPHRIDPDAAKVVKRLVRHGHVAYLVGGCVRDLLLGRTPKDFDIATSARPGEVKALFRNCRIIGRRFRLAHILFGAGKVLEVATFRRDPTRGPTTDSEWDESGAMESTGRDSAQQRAYRQREEGTDLLIRHDNVFGEPPEDAARRDFTMNALFYDLERREIVDYVGGMAEIERRAIRTIGEPDVRFREDPVRILRAIKFAARLDLGLEPDVYDAMVAHRDDLLRSARPRLLEELLRLLRGGASRRSIWLAWETGVLDVLVPELSSYLDDDPDGRSRLWQRLAAVDAQVLRGTAPATRFSFARYFWNRLRKPSSPSGTWSRQSASLLLISSHGSQSHAGCLIACGKSCQFNADCALGASGPLRDATTLRKPRRSTRSTPPHAASPRQTLRRLSRAAMPLRVRADPHSVRARLRRQRRTHTRRCNSNSNPACRRYAGAAGVRRTRFFSGPFSAAERAFFSATPFLMRAFFLRCALRCNALFECLRSPLPMKCLPGEGRVSFRFARCQPIVVVSTQLRLRSGSLQARSRHHRRRPRRWCLPRSTCPPRLFAASSGGVTWLTRWWSDAAAR